MGKLTCNTEKPIRNKFSTKSDCRNKISIDKSVPFFINNVNHKSLSLDSLSLFSKCKSVSIPQKYLVLTFTLLTGLSNCARYQITIYVSAKVLEKPWKLEWNLRKRQNNGSLKEGHSELNIAWKVPVFMVFLVRIFSYSDWIRKDTPYLSLYSPNAGKYGAEKLRILTLFTQWRRMVVLSCWCSYCCC